MSLYELLFLFAAVPLVVFWLRGMKVRESAIRQAMMLCKANNVQFLDGTVHLQRIAVQKCAGRWRFVRHYQFEFSQVESSPGYDRRYMGRVVFAGSGLLETYMDPIRIEQPE